jgi:hypothetical protein
MAPMSSPVVPPTAKITSQPAVYTTAQAPRVSSSFAPAVAQASSAVIQPPANTGLHANANFTGSHNTGNASLQERLSSYAEMLRNQRQNVDVKYPLGLKKFMPGS